MSRRWFSLLLIVGLFGVLGWIVTGCGGGASGGTTGLRISLVDAPLNASEVLVDIDSVQVHSASGGWTTVATYSPAKHVNLLEYRAGGNSLLLAESPLAAGHYTMVRLMLSNAQVVVDGQTYDVDLKNVAQTGVKCNGQFTVQSGELMSLTLDFNAERSFVNTGSGKYELHPVMSMSPVNVAAKILGSVEFQDANGAVLALPTDVVVNVYPQGQAGVADQLIAGAAVQTDGTFTIPVIAQGTYDIEIVSGGVVVKTLASTAINQSTVDLGKIIVTQ
jgi:hypothetical protein